MGTTRPIPPMHTNYQLLGNIVSLKLLAAKTCAKHRPVKHYKTMLAGGTGDSTNRHFSTNKN
jgi:hypothetical protein